MDFDVEYECPESLSFLSAKRQPFVSNLNVPNPLGGFDECSCSFKYLVDEALTHDEENFISVDDQLLGESQIKEVHTAVQKIVNYDYSPIPAKEKQGEISLALAAPFISYLTGEVGAIKHGELKILVLGAGVGKDIIRIRNAARVPVKITCVEPMAKASATLRKLFKDVNVIGVPFAEAYNQVIEDGPYDFILSNMSIHYIMGVRSGQQSAIVINNLLKTGGQFFGSYIDVPAVRQSGDGLHMKYGHSVMALGTDRNTHHFGEHVVNDIARVAVGGKIWRDPWLSTEQYYEAFGQTSMGIQIIDGTTFLYGSGQGPMYECPIPGFYKKPKRAELSVYRAILGVKTSATPNTPSVFGITPKIRDSSENGLAIRHLSVPFNKGMALGPDDIEFVEESLCWAGEKLDGVPVKLVHSARSLEMVIYDGVTTKPVRFEGFTSPYTKDFILQGELITHMVEGERKLQQVVVTDVLVAPWGVTGNFISRWRWLESVYALGIDRVDKKGLWPFQLQKWWHISDPDLYRYLPVFKEGVVLQSITAPPSIVAHNAGSARYVKRVYTIDVAEGNKIIERTLDGKFVRERPDKNKPNPPYIIDRIRAAVSVDEFFTMMAIKYGAHAGIDALRDRVVRHLEGMVPISEWSKGDVVYFHRHAHDPWFMLRYPYQVGHYNRLVLDHLAKQVLPMGNLNLNVCDGEEYAGSIFDNEN